MNVRIYSYIECSWPTLHEWLQWLQFVYVQPDRLDVCLCILGAVFAYRVGQNRT